MATLLVECLQRAYSVREVLEVVEFQVDELDCLSPQAQMHLW